MKAATLGRSCEFGCGWEPPGMVSRRIAKLLTTGGRRADDNSQQVTEQVRQAMRQLQGYREAPKAKEVLKRVESMPLPVREISWNAMIPARGGVQKGRKGPKHERFS